MKENVGFFINVVSIWHIVDEAVFQSSNSLGVVICNSCLLGGWNLSTPNLFGPEPCDIDKRGQVFVTIIGILIALAKLIWMETSFI